MRKKLETIHMRGFTKKRINGIIKLIIFLIILFICLDLLNNLLSRKYPYQKMEDFFTQEENFDVLFFGSSHMYMAALPVQLWKDYGIISYNMGQDSATLPISYYNLLLADRETNPKMVVIDIFKIEEEYKIYEKNRINSMHNTFDRYPLSYTKYIGIKDLTDNIDILDNTFEYLIPFSRYHHRWNELEKNDFVLEKNYEKGAISKVNVAIPKKLNDFKKVNIYNGEETVNMKYLRKIIEYCKKNNIEILVTYIPFPAPTDCIASSKYAQKICDEYDVNYINFLSMQGIINYNTDYYDTSSHLNPSGARKVTDYLGKYIVENYDIPDQRNNEAYSFWYEDYDEYVDFKISNLKEQEKNLNNYLMLLYDEKDIRYEIKISSKKEIKNGTILDELLENLNNNYEVDDDAFKEKKDKTIKITTWDNQSGEKIDTVWF